MSSRTPHIWGTAMLVALICTGPASALAAEPADLPALERAWHSCVREAYDQQPERGSRAGRERNALDKCKPHEDAYVEALMAARPTDDLPLGGWARTWAAYVAFVVEPVKAWIEALRREGAPRAAAAPAKRRSQGKRPDDRGAQLHGSQPGAL